MLHAEGFYPPVLDSRSSLGSVCRKRIRELGAFALGPTHPGDRRSTHLHLCDYTIDGVGTVHTRLGGSKAILYIACLCSWPAGTRECNDDELVRVPYLVPILVPSPESPRPVFNVSPSPDYFAHLLHSPFLAHFGTLCSAFHPHAFDFVRALMILMIRWYLYLPSVYYGTVRPCFGRFVNTYMSLLPFKLLAPPRSACIYHYS